LIGGIELPKLEVEWVVKLAVHFRDEHFEVALAFGAVVAFALQEHLN